MAAERRRLRVAFLTWRDHGHPDGGGSEVYVESVARELVARGHKVDVRCARYPGSTRSEDLDGVRILRRGGRLTLYPRALVWTWWRRRHYDVVVDVINGIPFLAPLVRRRGVVALIHHVHREQWHIIYPDWRGRLGWWIESRLTPVVYRGVPHLTVSQTTRQDLAALGVDPGRVTVAYNGLAPRPLRQGSHDADRLCVLSRLVPHKQIDHAFDVVARLSEQHPRLRLDVIGDGWWREELERAAVERGVADRVDFHGRVSADRRDEILAAAAVLLVPSVKEGWCLAVMEAATQGTPAIAYRSAGGVTESIVEDRTGLLVAGPEELVEATDRLLADREGRAHMGTLARGRALDYTWDRTADTVEQVLWDSVSPGRRR